MSTYEKYTTPVPPGTWDVPSTGAARFSWEYDDGRQRLLDLYQRGKDKQWDAATQAMDEARHIGLRGPKVQLAYEDLGVLDAADSDLDALMREDEDIAERIEREHAAEFAGRKAEVDAAIGAAEG